MATPETLSVEPDPFAPSFDGDLDPVESEEKELAELAELAEEDVRELPPYSFDSDDKTLAGIGATGSPDSSPVLHFDSSDRTLVGIGPAERAERAKLAESVSASQLAETGPESVPMPLSEPAGPFIVSDEEGDVRGRLPINRGEPWVVAVSGVLLAVAAVAFTRAVPRQSAPRAHAAAPIAPLLASGETSTQYAQFESAAAPSPETTAVDPSPADAVDDSGSASALATTQSEKQPELTPRRVTSKSKERLGALDVSSNSPAGLVLDGRPLGKAPLVVQLPSGPHTVLFVHPERGRMSVTVNVKAGRTTTASANF